MDTFKEIKDPQPDVPTLVRLQQNVSAWTRQFDVPALLPVQDVVSSASVSSYTVTAQDVFVVVDARGGPMKVVLPSPNRQRQAVAIMNAYGSAAVTIVQANGGKFWDGSGAIGLPGNTSANLVCNGRAWFRFGVV